MEGKMVSLWNTMKMEIYCRKAIISTEKKMESGYIDGLSCCGVPFVVPPSGGPEATIAFWPNVPPKGGTTNHT